MTAILSIDTTPEEILEHLTRMQDEGQFSFVLTTEPLGEAWVLRFEDGQLLRLTHHEVVSFLIGHQLALQWLMTEITKRDAQERTGDLFGRMSRLVGNEPEDETVLLRSALERLLHSHYHSNPEEPEAARAEARRVLDRTA